jgi:hypothetical protein
LKDKANVPYLHVLRVLAKGKIITLIGELKNNIEQEFFIGAKMHKI